MDDYDNKQLQSEPVRYDDLAVSSQPSVDASTPGYGSATALSNAQAAFLKSAKILSPLSSANDLWVQVSHLRHLPSLNSNMLVLTFPLPAPEAREREARDRIRKHAKVLGGNRRTYTEADYPDLIQELLIYMEMRDRQSRNQVNTIFHSELST